MQMRARGFQWQLWFFITLFVVGLFIIRPSASFREDSFIAYANSSSSATSSSAAEDCDDVGNIDEDGDGNANCLDSQCNGQIGNAADPIDLCEHGTEYTCTDDFDNDADGSVDCEDNDCSGDPSCQSGTSSSAASSHSSSSAAGGGDNSSSASSEHADMILTKHISTNSASEGDTVSYDLVAVNDGPGTANAVTITESIPTGLDFVSSTCSYSLSGGSVVMETLTLGAGLSFSCTVSFTVNGDVCDGLVVNSATVSSNEDPDAGNNTGSKPLLISSCNSGSGSSSVASVGSDSSSATSVVSSLQPEEDCDDPEQNDEDGDGYANCADSDCDNQIGNAADPIDLCEYGTEVVCNDDFDNDADEGEPGGGADCDDSDCSDAPNCQSSSISQQSSSALPCYPSELTLEANNGELRTASKNSNDPPSYSWSNYPNKEGSSAYINYGTAQDVLLQYYSSSDEWKLGWEDEGSVVVGVGGSTWNTSYTETRGGWVGGQITDLNGDCDATEGGTGGGGNSTASQSSSAAPTSSTSSADNCIDFSISGISYTGGTYNVGDSIPVTITVANNETEGAASSAYVITDPIGSTVSPDGIRVVDANHPSMQTGETMELYTIPIDPGSSVDHSVTVHVDSCPATSGSQDIVEFHQPNPGTFTSWCSDDNQVVSITVDCDSGSGSVGSQSSAALSSSSFSSADTCYIDNADYTPYVYNEWDYSVDGEDSATVSGSGSYNERDPNESQKIRMKNGSRYVVDVSTVSFNESYGNNCDLDWGTHVVSDYNDSKALFHYDSDYTQDHGIAAGTTFDLWIPYNEGDVGVRICPGATTLDQVADDCSGEVEIMVPDGISGSNGGYTATYVNEDGIEYWMVSGLSNTGGEGIPGGGGSSSGGSTSQGSSTSTGSPNLSVVKDIRSGPGIVKDLQTVYIDASEVSTATFTFIVTNNGTADATNVEVRDNLPKGFSLPDIYDNAPSITDGATGCYRDVDGSSPAVLCFQPTIAAGSGGGWTGAIDVKIDPDVLCKDGSGFGSNSINVGGDESGTIANDTLLYYVDCPDTTSSSDPTQSSASSVDASSDSSVSQSSQGSDSSSTQYCQQICVRGMFDEAYNGTYTYSENDDAWCLGGECLSYNATIKEYKIRFVGAQSQTRLDCPTGLTWIDRRADFYGNFVSARVNRGSCETDASSVSSAPANRSVGSDPDEEDDGDGDDDSGSAGSQSSDDSSSSSSKEEVFVFLSENRLPDIRSIISNSVRSVNNAANSVLNGISNAVTTMSTTFNSWFSTDSTNQDSPQSFPDFNSQSPWRFDVPFNPQSNVPNATPSSNEPDTESSPDISLPAFPSFQDTVPWQFGEYDSLPVMLPSDMLEEDVSTMPTPAVRFDGQGLWFFGPTVQPLPRSSNPADQLFEPFNVMFFDF